MKIGTFGYQKFRTISQIKSDMPNVRMGPFNLYKMQRVPVQQYNSIVDITKKISFTPVGNINIKLKLPPLGMISEMSYESLPLAYIKVFCFEKGTLYLTQVRKIFDTVHKENQVKDYNEFFNNPQSEMVRMLMDSPQFVHDSDIIDFRGRKIEIIETLSTYPPGIKDAIIYIMGKFISERTGKNVTYEEIVEKLVNVNHTALDRSGSPIAGTASGAHTDTEKIGESLLVLKGTVTSGETKNNAVFLFMNYMLCLYYLRLKASEKHDPNISFPVGTRTQSLVVKKAFKMFFSNVYDPTTDQGLPSPDNQRWLRATAKAYNCSPNERGIDNAAYKDGFSDPDDLILGLTKNQGVILTGICDEESLKKVERLLKFNRPA